MNSSNDYIIIKGRKPRTKHQQTSGGWKVAFADFALAMMAFFMVLWLVQITDEQEKMTIAKYINSSPFIDEDELTSMHQVKNSLIEMEGSMGLLDKDGDAIFHLYQAGESMRSSPRQYAAPASTIEELEAVSEEVLAVISEISAEDMVEISVQEQGVRIIFKDVKQGPMFPTGSTKISTNYRNAVLAISSYLKTTTNEIIISGHTDSRPYANNKSFYSNWELSSERALIARRLLVEAGIPMQQILSVAGMGPQVHRHPFLPEAPSNRRIELYLITPNTAQFLRGLYQNMPTPSRSLSDANTDISMGPKNNKIAAVEATVITTEDKENQTKTSKARGVDEADNIDVVER